MYCPKCGTKLCFCNDCKGTDNFFNHNADIELFICKGCKLIRPDTWWSALQIDINTEIDWAAQKVEKKEDIPEELLSGHEAPWGD